MKIKFISLLAGTFAKSGVIAAIAATAITLTPIAIQAQTASLNELLPVLSGVELTLQQKIQLVELASDARTQIGTILTTQQRNQFRAALAEGKGFEEAIAAMKISSEQRTQLQTLFLSLRTEIVSTFTTQQRQQILENVRSLLQL